jgi:hypothetical protein
VCKDHLNAYCVEDVKTSKSLDEDEEVGLGERLSAGQHTIFALCFTSNEYSSCPVSVRKGMPDLPLSSSAASTCFAAQRPGSLPRTVPAAHFLLCFFCFRFTFSQFAPQTFLTLDFKNKTYPCSPTGVCSLHK